MIRPPDLSFEKNLWRGGFNLIAGLDEAGRGALAGPVTVGLVLLPNLAHLVRALSGVRDSKQMTPRQREQRAATIKSVAQAWSLGWADADEIDSIGISAATRLAAERALAALTLVPDYLLTDFLLKPETEIPLTSLVKGDQKSLSIAAASVLAKTARDEFMRNLHEKFPAYGFSRHKGYGTALHREAIGRLGHSSAHRRTFQIRLMQSSKTIR